MAKTYIKHLEHLPTLSRALRKLSFNAYELAKTILNHLHALSRGLRAYIFLIYGFTKIIKFNATAGVMTDASIPAPKLFLIAAIAIELTCGLALLIGYKTRPVSLLLTLYLIPVTLVMHAFHMFADGQFVQEQMVQVLKNLAIMGGLLKFMADGPGAYSLDAKTYRKLLVSGPVLEIPIQKVNLQFNTKIVEPFGSLGTIYQDIRIVDIWGILNVSKCALINPTFTNVYVPAPRNLTDRSIQGDGWALDLASGWIVVAKERKGDYILTHSDRRAGPTTSHKGERSLTE